MSQKYQQLLLQLEVTRTEALKTTKTSTKPIIAITTRTTSINSIEIVTTGNAKETETKMVKKTSRIRRINKQY